MSCSYLDAHNVEVNNMLLKEIDESGVDNSEAEIKRMSVSVLQSIVHKPYSSFCSFQRLFIGCLIA